MAKWNEDRRAMRESVGVHRRFRRGFVYGRWDLLLGLRAMEGGIISQRRAMRITICRKLTVMGVVVALRSRAIREWVYSKWVKFGESW